ncbi:hypothetical protein ACRALDRAFT_2040650 [Sodiomyces alcalophilus JCM 7366]|uniref:uncharacterized protein n=1 Tax=Sodiomyces alcalophilus JCM 7366 TaxID=591952 RepID=UPI0039B487CC
MCEWYRRDYGCGHHLIGAAAWCPAYGQTHRRCTVRIAHTEFTWDECARCVSKKTQVPVPWEHMIDRSKAPMSLKWLRGNV